MLGQKIREIRELLGWTQAELAEKIGVAQATISDIEAGRNNPRLTTLIELARVFDMSVDELSKYLKVAPAKTV